MRRWLQNLVMAFIARYLPSKGKRIFYILMCYLAWSRSTDANQIRNELTEINNRLNLCGNNDALNFVIELRDILMGMDDFKPLRDSNHNDLRADPISHIPEWLRYDNNETILKDLVIVFKPRYVHTLTPETPGHTVSG